MSTFVRTFLAPYDVMAMLDGLTSHVSQMLQLHGAGVTVIRPDTPLEFITAAPPDLVKLEETQKESGAGPCVEAFRTGELQRVEDLASQSERWPEYSAAALAMNVKAVAGIPMRLGDR